MNRFLLLLVAGAATLVSAQVPGLGWCPEYPSMADFDLDKYTGVWYEQERYFTVLEVGSRCVRSNYTRSLDGKFRVSNEITNRLTGVRRVLDGVVQNIGKGGEGKIAVKYNTLPVPIDTQYSVLDTDYDTYSVVWSCSSLGPLNTQNAWVMTRERLAPGTVLQQAYGILDKYKISRNFFVKTDQSDCIFTDPAAIPPKETVDAKEEPVKEAEKPMPEPVMAEKPLEEKPLKADAEKPMEAMPMAEPKPMIEELVKPIAEPAAAPIAAALPVAAPASLPVAAPESLPAAAPAALPVAAPAAEAPLVESNIVPNKDAPIKVNHEKTEPTKL